jgi:tetratricopeptide (TPR) repeat protein
MKILYQPQSVVIHHESGSGIERYSRQDDNYHYFQKKWHSKIKPDYTRDTHRPYKLSPQSPIAGHAAPVLSMKYLPPNYIASQYFYRGELYHSQAGKIDRAAYCYRKARFFLQKVKEKNIYHDYRLASINKRLRCWRQAAAGFEAILSQNPGAQLKAGAYFHLGEIEMQRHNFTHARDFFKKTLEINPHHKKAAELLAGMNR